MKCPEGIAISSREWIGLQFCPKMTHSGAMLKYTGCLNLNFMVQKRQRRNNHSDIHHAAPIFCNECNFAVKFSDVTSFVSLDDKHHIKDGEPGYLAAAAERGQRVMVFAGTSFKVGNHDGEANLYSADTSLVPSFRWT